MMILAGVFAAFGCGGSDFNDGGDADTDSDTDTGTGSDTGPAECHPSGTEATDAAVWSHIQSEAYWDNWAHEPGADAPRMSDGPHASLAEIFVNDCVVATWPTGATQYPAGSMVVLDTVATGTGGVAALVAYRVTDDPAEAGWWWAAYQGGGVAVDAGASADVGCDDCHSIGDDLIRSFSLNGV